MKNIKNYFFLVALLAFAACYEEKEWVDENVEFTNKAVPAIFMNPLDSGSYTPGVGARVNLEFFCKDPLKEIRIYTSTGANITSTTRTLVTTLPYAPAFSTVRQQDTLLTSFVVPNIAKATRVWIHAEAVSQQDVAKGTWATGASSSRSFTIK